MKLKKLLAFVVALAMVMGIVPTMSIAAFADDSQVAEVDGTVYSSLAEAVTAAVDAYNMDEPIAVTLLADTDQDFTLEFGVIELVTDGYNYTGTATVTGALLIADCELENVVCTAKATNSDKTKFGYTSLEPGTEMVNGAQVRIGKGADAEGKVVGEESGLRFITTVDRMDTLAGIAYEHYDAGTSTYDEGYQIGAKIMAEGSNEEVTIPATLWQTEGEVFTTALTNLAEKNYNRRYTASAYVEVEGIRFEDDSYATRSIYQVAAGLLAGSDAKETNEMSQTLVNVLNAYVNQTGVRLTLSDSSTGATLEARTGSKNGAYTGEAFFTVGNTVYRNGMYKVTLKSVGKSVINTEIFNEYVRINNNNTAISRVTGITDNGDGTYTVTFDYADMDNGSGVINEPVTLANGNITAYIPAGVSFTGSADKLKLVLKSIDDENSEVEAEDGEELDSFDIHVNGVMEGNTTPIIITLTEVAEKGLNRGNLKLYHVEDGVQVEMEQVDSVEELTKHNQFTYEPLDGTIVVALASFSEVALVAEEDKAWKGNYDYSWYDAGATELTIANADQLAAFGAIVGGMAKDKAGNAIERDSFAGKTVKLTSDINLGDKESENNENLIFYPIGYYNSTGSYTKKPGGSVTSDVNSFEGTFDGNGHTISNFYQNTWEMFGDYNSGYSDTPNHYKDAMGLFGYVVGGTIKNLTVDNFSSDGEFTPTGVIAAYAVNSTFENIALTNCNPRVYNTGNGGIVGIGGNSEDPATYKLTFKNITIDNTNKITALWGSWDVACGGLVGMFRGAGHAYMTNCHVAAQIDVYNDVCGNYQYYWYRYAGMMIGTNKNMITDDNGYTVPETEKFHAENCTVHFGEWNDYYYCELVANSLASYTHDHQFSRLERVQKVEGTTITYLDGTTGTVPKSGRFNYVVETVEGKPSTVNASCYHFVDGAEWNHADAGTETVDGETILKEDKQHVYLPFNQLFTGYGWGVEHVPVYNGEDYAFEGITILDREEADSVKKFEVKFPNTETYLYRVGNQNSVSLDSLFKAVEGVEINDSGVYVSIDKVDENTIVSGKFTANTTDWTLGTIEFENTGVVKVTIQDYDYCTPTVLYLEVVDAKNATTASFSGNTVLLNDVSVSNTLSASGVVYGNGFTVNMENAPTSEKNGAVFHLYDGTILKNLSIVGKEFTTVAMNVNDTNYGVSAVRAWGTVIIENCYISGCRSAVSVTGTELTIKDSVIANGVYANVDFRSGTLNLHNVTTINEPHTVNGTTVLGLGIVGNMTASAGRKLNITGTLTQYNWVSQADCNNIKASGVDSIFNSVFTDDKYASLRYTYNGTTYVNAGILSLCNDFGASAVTGTPSDYSGMDVTATIGNVSVDGYVWAPGQAGTLTAEDMKYHGTVYTWISNNQGTSYVAPAFAFSNTDLTVEDDVVQISYESGSSYTLSADTIKALLPATKYGETLSYTVSMNGEDYTDKDIVFDATASQTYTITYTVTDNLVYDKAGTLTKTTYEVQKVLKVFATVVDKGADAPAFTFYYGTNGSASAGTPHTTQPTNTYTSTIKQVGETYYIMPNVSATTANAIGSQTVDGETIYYPIVDGINVRSGNATDYDFTRYYPVFKAVKISDNGTEYSYSGTTEMPATVAWVGATIDTGNGASALNDGFGLYNNQSLCKIQKKAGDAESGGTSVVKFSYTALDGNTYYYYVGYRFYDEEESTLCVTPDTLVTLADGSQKEIQYVTYEDELLVWNFYEGKYETVPASAIFNHGTGNMNVLNLEFEDGTIVRILGNHGLYDVDINNFIFIDEYNVHEYVGHDFVQQDGDSYKTVELVDYKVTEEYTTAYSILTVKYHNCLIEGMFSMTPDVYCTNMRMPYEVGEGLKYDEEKMQSDIEKYGLYTYEDFAEYATYEQFVAFDAACLKVAVGKGMVTFEELIYLIQAFVN